MADLPNFLNVAGKAVKLGVYHQLHVRIKRKRSFQRGRTHVPRITVCVNKYRDTALIDDGVQRGGKCHVRTKDVPTLQCAMADRRTAIEPLTRELYAQMQRSRAAGKGDRVFYARLFCRKLLHGGNIRADGRHPVCIIGFPDIPHLLAVHGRGGEPELFLKWPEVFFCDIHKGRCSS